MKILTSLFSISLALLMLGVGVANAATTYNWIDKQGTPHFSNVVPDEYKGAAVSVDQSAERPLPRELHRSTMRKSAHQADAAKAPEVPTKASGAVSVSQETPPKADKRAAGRPAKRPAKAPSADTDCETWQRLFQESGECFAPFRVVGGGIKKEAFEHCTPVVAPPLRCTAEIK
jgi:hypothetical protein